MIENNGEYRHYMASNVACMIFFSSFNFCRKKLTASMTFRAYRCPQTLTQTAMGALICHPQQSTTEIVQSCNMVQLTLFLFDAICQSIEFWQEGCFFFFVLRFCFCVFLVFFIECKFILKFLPLVCKALRILLLLLFIAPHK